MRRIVTAIAFAVFLVVTAAVVADVVIPDICTILPWWPGCPSDPGPGGGGSGAGN